MMLRGGSRRSARMQPAAGAAGTAVVAAVALALLVAAPLLAEARTVPKRSTKPPLEVNFNNRELEPTEYPLRFLVVGDWGRARRNNPAIGHNQTLVAGMMADVAGRPGKEAQFVVSTGDNFYGFGLLGQDDPAFEIKFTNMYNQSSLNVPWLAVMGNHDYGSGSRCNSPKEISSVLWQLGAYGRQRDPRWHGARNQVVRLLGGSVELFLLDSNPSISSYGTRCWASFEGGILTQNWAANVAWLKASLAASQAEWKIIVGHHSPRSSGWHGDNMGVQADIEPLIAQYGVQVYLAGHDHQLEHLQYTRAANSSTGAVNYHAIISGAGSRRYDEGLNPPTRYSKWGQLTDGFVAATLARDAMRLDFYTVDVGPDAPAYSVLIPRTPPVTAKPKRTVQRKPTG